VHTAQRSKPYLLIELAAIAAAIEALRILSARALLPGALALPLFRYAWLCAFAIMAAYGWLKYRGADLSRYGLKRGRWFVNMAVTALTAGGALALPAALQPVLQHMFGGSGEPDVSHFSPLRGNAPLVAYAIGGAWLRGAIGEELTFRGFLMTRLAELLGGARLSWSVALCVQAALFGLAHFYQGPIGAVLTGLIGLLMGLGYLVAGRSLLPVILAHGLVDAAGFMSLYLGLS
jgi:membrane protease YdiL (CAAX protease family)